MSLIVAATHDDDAVTLVADTKVTYVGDAQRPRRVFDNALPKLAILRPDLAVGVAGDDLHEVIETLVTSHTKPLERMLEIAARFTAASIVATTSPPRLFLVDSGTIDDRTQVRRTWACDPATYEHFQANHHAWP